MEKLWSLKNKKIVITGGTKGIGFSIAKICIELQGEICIVARTQDDLEEQASFWKKQGVNVYCICADVSDVKNLLQIRNHIPSHWECVDVLINNVGTNIRKQTVEYTLEEYHKIFATNATSTWELCRLFYPLLKNAKEGASVVNISSVASFTHIASGSVYSMTKAAIDQFTRYLSVEWAPDNIRVNAVLPWYTRTPLAEPVLKDKQRIAKIISQTPMKRIAEPEEVARVVVFLATAISSYVTGVIIPVDGGFQNSGLMP